MIERISGKLLEKSPTFCVIDCHGLGLGLHISFNTFQQFDKLSCGHTVDLYTYLHVREDTLQLYGFSSAAEREMFLLLISVSGVGAKLAIAVLSGSSSAELQLAISQEDLAGLTKIPGIGKKTAQRIILELKEKVAQRVGSKTSALGSRPALQERGKASEAVLALISLGYKEVNAKQVVDKIIKGSDDDLSLEVLIKRALKEM